MEIIIQLRVICNPNLLNRQVPTLINITGLKICRVLKALTKVSVYEAVFHDELSAPDSTMFCVSSYKPLCMHVSIAKHATERCQAKQQCQTVSCQRMTFGLYTHYVYTIFMT